MPKGTGGPKKELVARTTIGRNVGEANLNVKTRKQDVINSLCILSKINAKCFKRTYLTPKKRVIDISL